MVVPKYIKTNHTQNWLSPERNSDYITLPHLNVGIATKTVKIVQPGRI